MNMRIGPSMGIKSLSKSKGFSLVELLVSAAILAYALSVILVSFVNNMELTQNSRNLTKAITHAEFVMEDIRNTKFSDIVTRTNAGDWNWDTATITANGLNVLKSESIGTTVSGTGLLDITVTVSWIGAKQRPQTKSIRTLIAG